ncbi:MULTISPECIES: PFGI-1 class ICE element type IV pilus protein PilL2 [Pseudomonas syringae group genomosp. 2]|uniref:Conjugative transfer pilus protein PilL n=2 Tax=Pseudomonas amygdali TaxID=47877 RepID=A0A3M4L4D8_PSEA0|nr:MULTISPECIES: TcpQ domain-containing protein [Pseudomonas syringae group genomosp. 2]RMQ35881.1 Conjugative transfer pilus protein PilL [Pseudomonas amygdali pv. mori]
MIRQLSTLSILALFAGCTSVADKPVGPAFDSSQNPELLSPDLYSSGAKSGQEPMVRYGRYALVNTAPEAEQRDLMAQIIDVSIPANMHPSVQDAMQYVVSRSGYTLCPPSTGHVNILFTRPLPAAQYKLGPMSLRNTLQVLAGPAWQVKVNEVTRGVCFVLRPSYQLPETSKPVALAQPAQPASTGSTSVASTSPAVTVVTAPATGTPFSKDTSPAGQPQTTVVTQAKAQPAASISTPAKEGPPTQQKPTPVSAAPATATSQTTVTKSIASTSQAPTKPEPAAKPVATVASQQTWNAPVGSTLRQSVEDWAKRAGWQVIWVPEDLDYRIEAPLSFTGSFTSAVRQIFPLYDNAKRSFVVDGNEGNGQQVLHVSERKK